MPQHLYCGYQIRKIMKVKIGPYLNWWGPYQLCALLKHVGVHEDKYQQYGEWLSNTWVGDFCNWIYSKRSRTVKVKIDNYDVWGMDSTLSLIILPMLKLLKEKKKGCPFVVDADVPEHLRSTAPPLKQDEGDAHFAVQRRWDWVMDEMIWAFEHIANDDWEDEFFTGVNDRMFVSVGVDANGEELFSWEEGPNHTRQYDAEGYAEVQVRISNGTRLFGVYYQGLWD